MSAKHRFFSFALQGMTMLGAPRLVPAAFKGVGAILMLHHVRPWQGGAFAPNRLLEVTPDFLDVALATVRDRGFVFATLDDLVARLDDPRPGPPLAAITFDDGYRDNLDHALPVLRRHGAPATVFVTPGFAERTASLWWLDLEEAVARSERLEPDDPGLPALIPSATLAEKEAAFWQLYWSLRAGDESRLRTVIARLLAQAGGDWRGRVAELCLDWDGLRRFAQDPLIAIGAHTLTHPRLAKHPPDVARAEMAGSRQAIEAMLGTSVRHFAFPVGDPSSAGPRDSALARDLGFASAVTTRPGMVMPDHGPDRWALPRVSLNGHVQSRRALDALLTGLPFWLWNGGRLRPRPDPDAPSIGSAA